jgi:hypothetical protein
MMKGWKTWATAALSITYGIAGYFLGLHGPSEMMGFVTAGLGAVGIGHKIEKALNL